MEEYEQLFLLFKQYGNYWKKIATRFPGRSDNCIKNHFFSIIRKFLRKMVKLVGSNGRYTSSELVNKIKPRMLLRYLNSSIVLESEGTVASSVKLDITTVIKRYGFKGFHELKRTVNGYDLRIIERSLVLLAEINKEDSRVEIMAKANKIKKLRTAEEWRLALVARRERILRANRDANSGFPLTESLDERMFEISSNLLQIAIGKAEEGKQQLLDKMDKLIDTSNSLSQLMQQQRLLRATATNRSKPKQYQIAFNFSVSNQSSKLYKEQRHASFKIEIKDNVGPRHKADKIHFEGTHNPTNKPTTAPKRPYFRFKDVIREILIKEKGKHASLDDFLASFVSFKYKDPSEPLIKLIKCEADSTQTNTIERAEPTISPVAKIEKQNQECFRKLTRNEEKDFSFSHQI